MKIEKIDEVYINEFDGEAQGCFADCAEYRGKTSGVYKQLSVSGYYGDGSDRNTQEIIKVFGSYCYKEYSPKTCMYW
ncbi:MAG: hypothetical protein IKV85_04130 [Ruminococcus sp.]|nr:hypothetical protein [Ruminococcus sp.]